jgi:Fe2+ or Zn2+ uptake regulation protein
MTSQRRLVARLVSIIASPFSADELFELAGGIRNDARLTTPTVYRTLGELVDAQILGYMQNADQRLYSLC